MTNKKLPSVNTKGKGDIIFHKKIIITHPSHIHHSDMHSGLKKETREIEKEVKELNT